MMKKKLGTKTMAVALSAIMIALSGCTSTEKPKVDTSASLSQSSSATSTSSSQTAPQGTWVKEGSMELEYAENFSVDYYQEGMKLITISDGNKVLCVPKGVTAPSTKELGDNVIVLQTPVENMLVSSTPTTSLINALGALDSISMTTTAYEDWYMDEVKAALDNKKMTFIGSYKEPDYEAIVANKPPFAVFSTMLDSVPEVAEKLKDLEIPYILDQSTYENHPLARTEWAKLYGVLLGKEKEAEELYAAQSKMIADLAKLEKTDKTTAIFYITSKGTLYARNGGDYIAKMLEMAGGNYIYSDLKPTETGTSTITFEEFYAKAKDADNIIYIWSLGGKPKTLKDFADKNTLFPEFKAVKEGNVWCTTPDFFQISHTMGNMIVDMNKMLTNTDPEVEKFDYLFRLK